MNKDKDCFIDDSIRKDWSGEPIEYDGKPLQVYAAAPRPTFEKPHGCIVEEISMDEWEAARAEWHASRVIKETV
jgi:hypothetical protein